MIYFVVSRFCITFATVFWDQHPPRPATHADDEKK